MTRELGLRERKKLATRSALAESALRLCVERGFESVTVEHIATAAGVSLRTFFNYFSSKEEAVVAGDVERAAVFVTAFAGRPPHEPVMEALRRALETIVPCAPDRDVVARLRVLRRTPSLLPHQMAAYHLQERGLARAVAERIGADPDADLYPALFAAAVMAAARVVVTRWLDSPRTPLPDLVDALVEQLGAGFAVQASQVTGSECAP
ncbi:TetR family transcriptional regulator [Actinosynnema sp. NPDC020468]|uniref:acyl-CoA-like ligand-binding transcription factor n=1 Tax=Actinosynnema sp. NPDC020468 TaxID=3154488 RepID=UPI00340DED3A